MQFQTFAISAATGAGADRISSGMRHAYGKNVGLAARVNPGQKVMSVYTNKANALKAKEALRKASMKLPSPCTIVFERGDEKLLY